MGRRARIVALLVAAFVVLVAGVGYAYDSSQKDKIADGVTIGGVDVGGLGADAAERVVRKRLLGPLRRPLRVTFEGREWKLPAAKLKVRADIDSAVQEALEEGREGGLPARLVRYVSGGEVEASVSPRIHYSRRAIKRFVNEVAADVDREPRDADVEPSSTSLRVIDGEDGRKLRRDRLARKLEAAVLNARARGPVEARVRTMKPEVTRSEVAARYPSYLTLDRSTFTLRLWKHLKLAKTYTVAVGQEGMETPQGLYTIQSKEENPVWHVPNSDWAGDLAGKVIPPGPDNPIKARWMGIYDGAGIHGTEDVGSLGSAASHGCVRMSIPDVEELYDQVEVGTPIYIG